MKFRVIATFRPSVPPVGSLNGKPWTFAVEKTQVAADEAMDKARRGPPGRRYTFHVQEEK